MQPILLCDETYNNNYSEHYSLFVRLLQNCYTIIILDNIRKKYVYLKHVVITDDNDYKKKLYNDEIFNNKFENSNLIFSTNSIFIVPKAFSDKNNLSNYSKFNSGEENSEIYISESPFETSLHFILPELFTEIKNKFSSFNVIPHSLLLLKQAEFDTLKSRNCNGLYIFLMENSFEAVVLKGSSLQLFNVYEYKSIDDFLYFVNLLFELFKLDKDKDFINISGLVQKNDSLIKSLETFFKNIMFSKFNSSNIYSYKFNEVPEHFFSDICYI